MPTRVLTIKLAHIYIESRSRESFFTFQMQTLLQDSTRFLSSYVLLSEIYSNMFSFLIAMCVTSVFDK